ncbi:MAG TPA: polyphosphate polymerase domain-containing protein [Pseudogracilibacillus sp.]|nr:polyphosphate polymerase domain-containing protein [Pseudogracilibacillus sp.]
MAIEFFTRREQKYLITKQQYEKMILHLSPHMRPDLNGQDGFYSVTSLYFDNDEGDIYYETKNKLKFRQKLRLRIYDQATLNDRAFFEIKQKNRKVVHKRRMVLPLREAYDYLGSLGMPNVDAYQTSNQQVFKEIDSFKQLYRLKPEMIVSYDRQALHGINDDDLRITFDMNLRCRKDDLRVENGPYGMNFIDPNLVVLEVKVTDSIPLWLTRILQKLACENRSASKYCTSYELLHQMNLAQTYHEPVLIGG